LLLFARAFPITQPAAQFLPHPNLQSQSNPEGRGKLAMVGETRERRGELEERKGEYNMAGGFKEGDPSFFPPSFHLPPPPNSVNSFPRTIF
jgi:hypothetical protein